MVLYLKAPKIYFKIAQLVIQLKRTVCFSPIPRVSIFCYPAPIELPAGYEVLSGCPQGYQNELTMRVLKHCMYLHWYLVLHTNCQCHSVQLLHFFGFLPRLVIVSFESKRMDLEMLKSLKVSSKIFPDL